MLQVPTSVVCRPSPSLTPSPLAPVAFPAFAPLAHLVWAALLRAPARRRPFPCWANEDRAEEEEVAPARRARGRGKDSGKTTGSAAATHDATAVRAVMRSMHGRLRRLSWNVLPSRSPAWRGSCWAALRLGRLVWNGLHSVALRVSPKLLASTQNQNTYPTLTRLPLRICIRHYRNRWQFFSLGYCTCLGTSELSLGIKTTTALSV